MAIYDRWLYDQSHWLHDLKLSVHTQSAFTCWKLTIETLEQDVEYVQS